MNNKSKRWKKEKKMQKKKSEQTNLLMKCKRWSVFCGCDASMSQVKSATMAESQKPN